jgi:hypothetical protein
MKTHIIIAGALALLLAGCSTPTPYDYSAFDAHPPRSILVLPPINQSTDVKGTYGYLSTVTRPLAEKGYYVYPVMLIDQFMKENGQTGAEEMQQVPLDKIRDVIGADAILYVTLEQYGTRYQIVNSVTEVRARATLLDVKTGLKLWDGSVDCQQNASGGSGNPIADLIATALDQIINSSTDQAHNVAALANAQMLTTKNRALPDGPYKKPK